MLAMTSQARLLPATLLMTGLGGALFSSSILAGATLLLAITGGILIFRKSLHGAGWEKPKELRLLHFAFWFFVLVSALSWALEGFDYEGGKTLGAHARLLLFWPLVIALTYARLGARAMFFAIGLAAASVIVIFVTTIAARQGALNHVLNSRFGGGINPISFGNLALLVGMLAIVGSLFLFRDSRKVSAFSLLLVGLCGAIISMLSETRSNLVALPFLLLTLIPLLGRKLRVAGLVAIPILVAATAMTSDRMASSLEGFLTDRSLDNGMEIRMELWSEAWHLFTQHPATGAGLGGFTRHIESEVSAGNLPTGFLECCTGDRKSVV